MRRDIREYALDKLTQWGGELTKRAHAAYYLVLAERALPMKLARTSEWLNCLI